jgi:AcrR family transcriptional regulator
MNESVSHNRVMVTAKTNPRRPRLADRLDEVVQAGARVFARRGYRRTQMADVAAAMGVSPGNLYNYVDSKDALFYLVLRRMLGERADEQPLEFPVTDASVTVTADWVARRLDFVSDFPELERALKRSRVREHAVEVEAVAGELFDVLSRMRLAVDMIERSVDDLPELAQVFGAVRQELLARYERYVALRARPRTIAAADPEAVAHLFVELCSWAARRRPNDPHAGGISDVTARRTVCRFIADALASDAARPGRSLARARKDAE